jgi:hypothetical protein
MRRRSMSNILDSDRPSTFESDRARPPLRFPREQPGKLGTTGSSGPADTQLIVIENSFSLKAPRSSVTRTVHVNVTAPSISAASQGSPSFAAVPAVVGVPETVFSRLRQLQAGR